MFWSKGDTKDEVPSGRVGLEDASYVESRYLEQGSKPASTSQEAFTNRAYQGPEDISRLLAVNLLITKVTVWIMFVVSVVNMAFAVLIQDELKDDPLDANCDTFYIYGASRPADPNNLDGPGQYHAQCHMLLTWSYIVTVAGSFGVARTLMQGLPVYYPTLWTIKYQPGSATDRMLTPSRVYIIRTVFSAVPFILYIVCIPILATNRMITKQPGDIGYQIMYKACLGIIAASTAASGHQAITTAVAAIRLRGWKK